MGAAICQEKDDQTLLNNDSNDATPNSIAAKKESYDCVQVISHHKKDVTCLIVLKDSRLASSSVDNTIAVWREDPNSNFIINSILYGHSNSVISLSELLNNILCSTSVDKTLRLWKLASMTCYKILSGHEDSVLVSLQLKSEMIVSGSDDKTIRIWTLNKANGYSVVKILTAHQKPVSTVIAIEAKDKIISGSDDGTVRIWSIDQMVCVDVIDDLNDSAVYCIKYNRNNLIIACGDGNVYFFEFDNLAKTHLIQFSKFGVLDFFIYQPGKIIGFACADAKARIWKMGTPNKITLKGHSGVVTSIKRLPNGRVVTCSQDKTIRIWKFADNPDDYDNGEKKEEEEEEEVDEEEEEVDEEEEEVDEEEEEEEEEKQKTKKMQKEEKIQKTNKIKESNCLNGHSINQSLI